MRLIDKQWLVRGNDVFHICRGDENAKGPHSKISLEGFWPTEENKCKVCQTEIPNQVKIYLEA